MESKGIITPKSPLVHTHIYIYMLTAEVEWYNLLLLFVYAQKCVVLITKKNGQRDTSEGSLETSRNMLLDEENKRNESKESGFKKIVVNIKTENTNRFLHFPTLPFWEYTDLEPSPNKVTEAIMVTHIVSISSSK